MSRVTILDPDGTIRMVDAEYVVALERQNKELKTKIADLKDRLKRAFTADRKNWAG